MHLSLSELIGLEDACQTCKSQPSAELKLLKCVRCKCVRYCGKECQKADWQQHKQYCNKLLFVAKADLPAFDCACKEIDPAASETYQAAMRAAAGNPRKTEYIEMAEIAAKRLVKCCSDDVLPSGPAEEAMWGMYGDPKSQGYQRVYVAYQMALKYGNLSAQKLMECLLARPNASKALTEAIQNSKIVQCEGDNYEMTTNHVDNYYSRVAGLQIVSACDKYAV